MEQTFENGTLCRIHISSSERLDEIYIEEIGQCITITRTTALEIAQYILDNYTQQKTVETCIE